MADGDVFRRAYRMWQSESEVETYLAVALVVVTVGPSLYGLWQSYRGGR